MDGMDGVYQLWLYCAGCGIRKSLRRVGVQKDRPRCRCGKEWSGTWVWVEGAGSGMWHGKERCAEVVKVVDEVVMGGVGVGDD